MINPETINMFVTTFAGFLSSLGIIVGVIYKWVWKPWAKKKADREEAYRQTMTAIASGEVGPIAEQVKVIEAITTRHEETDGKLMEILEELKNGFENHNEEAMQRDILIKQNIEMISTMKDQLEQHSDRLLLLEYASGLRTGYEMGDKNAKLDTDK